MSEEQKPTRSKSPRASRKANKAEPEGKDVKNEQADEKGRRRRVMPSGAIAIG
ncbi:hypothetical protein GCM10007160_18280 [Litchfieldella qijiaojingensis]|uniref:Uncharacterized protein n=1 Tax=Litchfieldella qijiaojingensis TaxID=980347 RepID=A0ABQ2YSM0_9GAMM|nr:hypothetical protein [Halomonas qijiaojingensis]GGX91140.1 hypothetical protein GCM10007160_18280 [Halomonas qijiaojingensis]